MQKLLHVCYNQTWTYGIFNTGISLEKAIYIPNINI